MIDKYAKNEIKKIDDIPDGLSDIGGCLFARCHSCGQRYEWPASIQDFINSDKIFNVCNGSDRCTI